MKKYKKFIVTLLVVFIFQTTAFTAFAGPVSYRFTLNNTGQSYNTYTGSSNRKDYAGDAATVRVQSMSNAQGAGVSFVLQYKGWLGYTKATSSVWMSGIGITHPGYLSGQNKTDRHYYVAARKDDDFYSQTTCSGYYNADYIN